MKKSHLVLILVIFFIAALAAGCARKEARVVTFSVCRAWDFFYCPACIYICV